MSCRGRPCQGWRLMASEERQDGTARPGGRGDQTGRHQASKLLVNTGRRPSERIRQLTHGGLGPSALQPEPRRQLGHCH
jgi:hypothetical protein